MNPIGFVTATRSDRSTFLRESALGLSLARMQALEMPFDLYLAENNSSPLAQHYNRSIRQAPAEQILVFVHDDVGLLDLYIAQRLEEALRHFDAVGVAGNRVMYPRQPAWAFPEKLGRWDSPSRLLGAVHHSLPNGKQIFNRYGDTRCNAAVLDGLFIASTAGILRDKYIGFDTALAFHFYDLDFCMQLKKAGLSAGVWPISISHASPGAFGGESWKQSYEIFCKKYWKSSAKPSETKVTPANPKDVPVQVPLA